MINVLAILPPRIVRRITASPNGCWVYTGSLTGDGYAMVRWDGKTQRLHRVVFGIANGAPAVGDVDHECHNGSGCPGGKTCPHRACVRPDHLADKPHRENVLAGEGLAARQARRTHCVHGHEFTPENTLTNRRKRKCRACMNIYNAAKARGATGPVWTLHEPAPVTLDGAM